MDEDIVVNEAENRFENKLGDGLAMITYELNGNVISLMHTEVPEEDEGQGIASDLAAFALDYARNNKLKVKVYCEFVQIYLKRHPEYQDLIIQ